jgi:nucleotide-binding universal stress UspA family protein
MSGMKRFKRILVGIDLTLEGDEVSIGSRRAALQGQWLAERTGASLTFLHSTWTDLYEDHNVIHQGPGPRGRAALERLAKEYEQSGTSVELVTVDERAWLALIRRVLAGKNDLVVVARRNTPGSTVLGSTSSKLLRKCPCPVWVVKPDAELLHQCVLAATDLTPVGDAAVELGAAVAKIYGCPLHVVHAWQQSLEMQLEGELQSETEHQAALAAIQTAAEEHILAAYRAIDPELVDPDLAPKLHVGRDAPSRAILEGVKRLHADLLVMGSISRAGISGLLVGNTAERLLDRVDCSLLTIKPRDFASPVTTE